MNPRMMVESGMGNKSLTLGDIMVTVDEINMVMNGDIICTFHLSHKGEPKNILVELYGEVSGDQLEVLCKTQLTARRFEIFSRFLYLYEKNIVRFFKQLTEGTTPDMFKSNK